MTEKKRATKRTDKAKESFEEALSRLEKIVEELEGKDLSLEDALARYEEGSRLVASCTRRLEEAEQRIRKIAEASATTDEIEKEDHEGEEDGGLPF